MTVPCERTNAVISTETFLKDLCDPQKTPRVPRAIRQRARSLLRHYPSQFEMDMISQREDGDMKFPTFKVFGKGFQ